MSQIFPEEEKSLLLKHRRKVSSFYSSYFTDPDESPDFGKTINRNLKFVEAIRNKTVKRMYNPSEGTLKVFVAYYKNEPETSLEFKDFISEHEIDISDYISKHPVHDKVYKALFPKLPEKLIGIEKRILKALVLTAQKSYPCNELSCMIRVFFF